MEPKWSISNKKFIDCDVEYQEAQEDIVGLLIEMGDNKKELEKWCLYNEADFTIID